MQLLGIDTGGTFTDFVLYRDGAFITKKILSTPRAPAQAILQGIQSLEVDMADTHCVHGTTVATNALLESKGARTAFITNKGFKDLLHIGRQTRNQLYSLAPHLPRQLVDHQLCFEICGRISASGNRLEEITPSEITALKHALHEQGAEAVAICMLFSFLDPRDEISLDDELRREFFVSRSSALLPEQKEYERAVVTWLNAYLGPTTQSYLQDLQKSLGKKRLHVMQSDATTIPAEAASRQAVKLLLSGPAGGAVAAASVAASTPWQKLLTIDMGGTSTDVALIDRNAQLTTEGRVAEFPLSLPMLDIHTIGAGGGSMATVDRGGGLHVGPESAGADPGPACYDRGGKHATITDANVVLGRLPVFSRWASGLKLNRDQALLAMQPLARELHCSVSEAAKGIVALANSHMVEALRVISIHRGYDPADFCLFPFGGAGALHMCEIAEALDCKHILVPANSGILSAYGMLQAPIGQSASRSLCVTWQDVNEQLINETFDQLTKEARAKLRASGLSGERTNYWLDLRYLGQSSVISLPWQPNNDLIASFSHAHHKQFGFNLPQYPVEIVTARVWVVQEFKPPELPPVKAEVDGSPVAEVKVESISIKVPVFTRQELAADQRLAGPTIVLDESSTLFINENWRAVVQVSGHIHLHRATGCH